MQRQIIICITLAFSIWSCTSNKNESQNNFILDKRIKLEAKVLHVDTIGFFDELIYARDFRVYQDSILVVRNHRYSDVYFLEFYNLNQKKSLRQMYRLGNGPDELLSANIYINQSTLTAVDYVKDYIAFPNIDSLLYNADYNKVPIKFYPHSPVVVQYKKENQMLVENPYCFKDEESGIDNHAPRFIIYNENSVYVEKNKYKYYTWNVATNGRIITNYQKNRIVYANTNLSVIEIYDADLCLLKQIKGPDNLIPEYKIVSDEYVFNEVLFRDHIPYTYLDFCVSDDFFCLTYLGDYFVDKKKITDYPLWIFKFDWDGNFMESYSIGRYVSCISLSADGKSFYASAVSEEETPFLIKLSLE
jgi:hypothetical protein